MAASAKSFTESTTRATAEASCRSKENTQPVPAGKSRRASPWSRWVASEGWWTRATAGCASRAATSSSTLDWALATRSESVSMPVRIAEAEAGASVGPRSCRNLERASIR